MGPKTDIVGTKNNDFLMNEAITLHIPSNSIKNIFGSSWIFLSKIGNDVENLDKLNDTKIDPRQK